MKDNVLDQVVFSVAIVYSRSLFDEIKAADQHIIISLLATVVAIATSSFHRSWTSQTNVLQEKNKKNKNNANFFLWRKIVSQWLEILSSISTFIAIHVLVDLVDTMIVHTERFYYESFLFPMITILFSIAVITIFDSHFFSSK